jgi:hypothetical protein
MNSRIISSFAILTLISSTTFAADDKKESSSPEDQAVKWMAGLGEKGLVIEEESETGFIGRKVAGRNSTYFVLNKDGWYISLGFDGTVDRDTSLKQIRKSFKYIALDKLPTPGLEVPGWEIRPQTPVSSFKKGVEIVGFEDGKIKLRVKTKFFALYGRDPNVLVPADAPSPKSSYFQIRKPFSLDMTLEAPFAMKK